MAMKKAKRKRRILFPKPPPAVRNLNDSVVFACSCNVDQVAHWWTHLAEGKFGSTEPMNIRMHGGLKLFILKHDATINRKNRMDEHSAAHYSHVSFVHEFDSSFGAGGNQDWHTPSPIF